MKKNIIKFNDFPQLTIVDIDMNYSFIFNGEELFMKKNDKIIFQIVAKSGRTDGQWILGIIFLKKY